MRIHVEAMGLVVLLGCAPEPLPAMPLYGGEEPPVEHPDLAGCEVTADSIRIRWDDRGRRVHREQLSGDDPSIRWTDHWVDGAVVEITGEDLEGHGYSSTETLTHDPWGRVVRSEHTGSGRSSLDVHGEWFDRLELRVYVGPLLTQRLGAEYPLTFRWDASGRESRHSFYWTDYIHRYDADLRLIEVEEEATYGGEFERLRVFEYDPDHPVRLIRVTETTDKGFEDVVDWEWSCD